MALYATRPWRQYAEGPTTVAGGHFGDHKLSLTSKDVRFTRSKDGGIVYAILMDWPGDGVRVDIEALGNTDHRRSIEDVTLLGHKAPIEGAQEDGALGVMMPDEKPCDYAFALKVVSAK